MASGTLGADELPREKHKWSENSKVYTRRIFRNPKNRNSNTNNNSNSSVVTTTPASKDQSNGKNNGEKRVFFTIKSNGGETRVVNGVVSNNSRVNDVAELPSKENCVEAVPGNENVGEGSSNLKRIDEEEELPVHEKEKVPENGTSVEDVVPDNGNNNNTDDGNRVEEVARNENDDMEMSNDVVNEVPINDVHGEELRSQENNIDEMPANLYDRDDNIEEVPQKSPSPRLPVEQANSSQPLQNSPRRDTVTLSEDSLSLNRGERPLPNGHDQNLVNGVVREERQLVTQVDDRLNISVTAAKSKEEVRDLKRKLEDDLNEVRKMARRLEAKESQLNSVDFDGGRFQELPVVGRLQFPANGGLENGGGGMRGNPDSGPISFGEPRPFRPLSVAVMDNNHHGVGEPLAKEKRTPKANQYYRNSEFLLGKEKLPPAEANRKSKSSGGGRKRGGGEFDYGFGVDKKIFKKCSDLLQKLRNHKHGWVFNQPVDVKMLGLHDYFDIIKHPMDLGTVEARLTNNWYKTPREFAEDVRLTFHNAMTYNPEGQDVHVMAKDLLKIFEEKWPAVEADYDRKLRYVMMRDLGTPTPTSRKSYAPVHMPIHMPLPPPLLHPAPTLQQIRNLERSKSMPVRRSEGRPVGRTPAPKKPKAKDPHKRDMTFDEKQKLSTNLQSLPSEKLDSIVQIIKKNNSALSQHEDEIEVDIDSVDTETLWELDRFVTNYKKSLSKYKRKAEIAQAKAAAQGAQAKVNAAPVNIEAPREDRPDERNAAASPQPEQERRSDNASDSSSSSSSSSDSGSSSSDSDSDSSSDSGSDGNH